MNSSFDGRTQIVQILGFDGITPVFVSLADITTWLIYNTQSSILYGAQMGALLIMLLITAALTSDSKRRKPIFILNCLSLFFGFLRALLRALYSTSNWVDIYATFAYDYQYVPQIDYSTSVAGNVFNLLMTITVNSSLFLQAYTVAKTMTQKQKLVISFFSAVMMMASIGSQFAATVTNNIAIVQGVYLGSGIVTIAVAEAVECAAYWYFSLIFTSKLIWTVRARYTMGLRRWGITQVLCVMGFCTMVIPCKYSALSLSLLEFYTNFPKQSSHPSTSSSQFAPPSLNQALWPSHLLRSSFQCPPFGAP